MHHAFRVTIRSAASNIRRSSRTKGARAIPENPNTSTSCLAVPSTLMAIFTLGARLRTSIVHNALPCVMTCITSKRFATSSAPSAHERSSGRVNHRCRIEWKSHPLVGNGADLPSAFTHSGG